MRRASWPIISPRVYEGEAREKWLVRSYCHRTGRHCRDAKVPLTRLRCALSRLWQDHPPHFASLGPPPQHIRVTEVI
jgi:hypothetical protein